ncbi:hypothetical protein [Coprococcus comes]|uniref:hypothetical protein n=1 Tax=Coprococcus comes TaxID=410072 RepID=UPI00189B8137|nr:hypothetical protein [Coprococcus comes]
MSVELTTIYAPKTDELFAAESKISLLTNTDYDWTGAHTVKVWKISTSEMNDYSRNRVKGQSEVASVSRYGELIDLNAQTEEMTLKKDRSFIFNIDKIDMDETAQQLAAETALARQLREVVIPEVDKYTYGVMAAGAGRTVVGDTTTPANIYSLVLAGSEFLDDNEVPETERALVVVPSIYTMLKQSDIFDKTDVGAEMRARGVVATLDGMNVIKIPSKRMPANFGFMIAHPSATTAPVKLEDYGMHENTPLSSGTIVTGRICYDAFVLDNKKKGIYVYKTK